MNRELNFLLLYKEKILFLNILDEQSLENLIVRNAEDEETLIYIWKQLGLCFDEDTPEIILRDMDCIKISIKNSLDSIKYIDYIIGLEDFIIEEALRQNYVLHDSSPEILKKSERVVINSLKLNKDSLAFALSPASYETSDALVVEMLKLGLSVEEGRLQSLPIKYLLNRDYSNLILDNLGLCKNETIRTYYNLIIQILNNDATPESFIAPVSYIADTEWEKYRNSNREKFDNLFSKYIIALQSNSNFESIEDSIPNLKRVLYVLGSKDGKTLINSMKEYFVVYHNFLEQRSDLLEKSKKSISSLISKYVALEKENHKAVISKEVIRFLKPFFKVNTENKNFLNNMKNRIGNSYLKMKYTEDSSYIKKLLSNLRCSKIYSGEIDFLEMLTIKYIENPKIKLENIISPPSHYFEYMNATKIKKVVTRLNMGYVTVDDDDIKKYKPYIVYDETKKQYFPKVENFNILEVAQILEYDRKLNIFSKLKKEINDYVKANVVVTEDDYNRLLGDDLAFSSRYYAFNRKLAEEQITIGDLYPFVYIVDGNTNDITENINNLISFFNIFIHNSIIWFILFHALQKSTILNKNEISYNIFHSTISNIDMIMSLEKRFYLNVDIFKDFMILKKICLLNSKDSTLDIETVIKLATNLNFVKHGPQVVLEMANRLRYNMGKKTVSAIPNVSGSYHEYRYHIYGSSEEEVFFSGIDTESCFKVGGTDNDFFHYCILSKDGFVLKIENKHGEFIGKVAGFRNGNCLFMNGLTSIYDNSDISDREREEIILLLDDFCNKVINASQNNPEESDEKKIKYIFMTKFGIYGELDDDYLVPKEVEKRIGNFPINVGNKDWVKFCENSTLEEIQGTSGRFTIDIGKYPLLCLYPKDKKITGVYDDILFGDVKPTYVKKRKKVRLSRYGNREIKRLVGKTYSLKFYETGYYSHTSYGDDDYVLYGENWCILFNETGILDVVALDFDEKAIEESKYYFDLIQNHKIDVIKKKV